MNGTKEGILRVKGEICGRWCGHRGSERCGEAVVCNGIGSRVCREATGRRPKFIWVERAGRGFRYGVTVEKGSEIMEKVTRGV